ncbi:uroporphyrinogen-III synthase [Bacillus sp. JCM 19034]|uniref:uroporphyrinogen-III synthase n=1 Tax=Bacillus sp. JCM 19034 TaxID=1481928 RepID=UPI000782557A|nr:uroporphyrinogen-III synthase [Bacillus sp. JCM 19034]
MGKGLSGKRVVLAASRKTEEMSLLVKKQGGTPIVRSLQGTVFLASDEGKPALLEAIEKGFDWAIFTTGIGTEALLEMADEIALKDTFMTQLQQAKLATRGYKTFGVLSKLGLEPDVKDDDGTVAGLMNKLNDVSFDNKRVLVQLHGENVPRLITYLQNKGAMVNQLLPYQHVPPDEKTISLLLQEINNDEIDAICFTSAIQVRSLFRYINNQKDSDTFIDALNNKVVAVAVGKVTAEALEEEGIKRIVYPEFERMGAMIIELSRYFSEKGKSESKRN